MTLTDQQTTAVSAANQGCSIRLQAYAGTGKTSTLYAMSQAKPSPGAWLYLAFNRAIADEAAHRFRGQADCRTAHSLAFRDVCGSGMPKEKMLAPLNGRSMRSVVLPTLLADEIGERLAVQLIADTIRRFCQSAAETLTCTNVRKINQGLISAYGDELPAKVAMTARGVWEMAIDPRSSMPLGHDGYLKLWALCRPRLDRRFRCVLVDEAQDLNPVLLGIIADQTCQVVSVGDGHQQIYEWRGAVDALKHLPGVDLRLTRSFRFGTNIADAATRILNGMGEDVPCEGNPEVSDFLGIPNGEYDATVCRTNAGVIDVLMRELKRGSAVYLAGGSQDLAALISDAERLKSRQPATGLELLGFRDWKEVVDCSETDDGAELRVLVSLVERFGTAELLRALSATAGTPGPGVKTVSTAHKAKGLEWDELEIGADFAREKTPSLEEQRLFYVACTRAKRVLAVEPRMLRVYAGEEEDDCGIN